MRRAFGQIQNSKLGRKPTRIRLIHPWQISESLSQKLTELTAFRNWIREDSAQPSGKSGAITRERRTQERLKVHPPRRGRRMRQFEKGNHLGN
jgi:hypothetical protein